MRQSHLDQSLSGDLGRVMAISHCSRVWGPEEGIGNLLGVSTAEENHPSGTLDRINSHRVRVGKVDGGL